MTRPAVVILAILAMAIIVAAPAAAAADRSCPDYCANGMAYSRGTYNSYTGSCDYSYRTACDYGCDARGTGCSPAPAATTAGTQRSCPEYCSGGIHSFNGAWSSILQQCTYMSRTCVHGCDGSGITCARNPAGCPEYCRDGFRHFNGSWNEWAQQCDYGYQEQCLAGCDARGIACAQAAATPAPSETGRFITCSADCSCISRQAAVDRWGSNVRMCSNSPCGKMGDGTDLYCIQPTGQAPAQPTSAATERYINCPADCSCISRQGAVDRWQGSVRMCSNEPCGRASDGIYLYCIQPTEERTTGIRQRYSGPSETVIAVNPAFEGEQLVFVVSRERQAMLLGFIPVRMEVSTRLNGTDLAVIREERPWWGFLVAGEAAPAPAPATPTPTPTPLTGAGAAGNCTDTDGKNLFVNGTAQGLDYTGTKSILVSDHCAATPAGAQTTEGQYLVEQQCLPNGHVGAFYYKCPDCYWCSVDKCVPKPSQGCGAACANQSWNVKCYNSSYDLDYDCNMTKAAATACESKIVNQYGKSEYDIWLASYPWDCNDSDPLQCGFSPACVGVICPAKCEGKILMSDGKCSELSGECIYKTAVPDSPNCKA